METKKILIVIIISGIASLMGVASYAMFRYDLEGALPVTHTLSSEELAGLGYTSMTAPDDSDMWEEDDIPAWVRVTEVPDAVTEMTEITVSFPLDINTATAEELMLIDGIGNVTAESIISYREKNGYFYSLEDLLNVDGIGEKRLAEMADFIFIDPSVLPETDKPDETSGTEITVPVPTENETETVTVSVTDAENIFPLELNTAAKEELMQIEGVGEVLAERIADYAEQHGFNDVNDLLDVSGIGEKKLESIAPYVYVGRR